MLMSVVHACLQLLIFLTFVFAGKQLSKRESRSIVWLSVIVFTLVEGLRFGRGIDYNIYANNYLDGNFKENTAFIFNLLSNLFHELKMPFQSTIFIYSGVLSYFGINWLLRYPQVIKYSLPLFYFFTYSAENLYRWYTGFVFLLFAIDYLRTKEYWKSFLYVILSMGFHIMLLPFFLFCGVLCKLAKDRLIPPCVSIVLFLMIMLSFKPENMLFLNFIADSFLGEDAHYSMYASNIDEWLTGENSTGYNMSVMRYIIFIIVSSFFLFMGYYAARRDNRICWAYNIMSIGIITYPGLHFIELADRYNQLFLFYEVLIGAYCMKTSSKSRIIKQWVISESGKQVQLVKKKKPSRLLLLLYFFVVIVYAQDLYKRMFPQNKYYTMYIWDSGEKIYIDKDLLIKNK